MSILNWREGLDLAGGRRGTFYEIETPNNGVLRFERLGTHARMKLKSDIGESFVDWDKVKGITVGVGSIEGANYDNETGRYVAIAVDLARLLEESGEEVPSEMFLADDESLKAGLPPQQQLMLYVTCTEGIPVVSVVGYDLGADDRSGQILLVEEMIPNPLSGMQGLGDLFAYYWKGGLQGLSSEIVIMDVGDFVTIGYVEPEKQYCTRIVNSSIDVERFRKAKKKGINSREAAIDLIREAIPWIS